MTTIIVGQALARRGRDFFPLTDQELAAQHLICIFAVGVSGPRPEVQTTLLCFIGSFLTLNCSSQYLI